MTEQPQLIEYGQEVQYRYGTFIKRLTNAQVHDFLTTLEKICDAKTMPHAFQVEASNEGVHLYWPAGQPLKCLADTVQSAYIIATTLRKDSSCQSSQEQIH